MKLPGLKIPPPPQTYTPVLLPSDDDSSLGSSFDLHLSNNTSTSRLVIPPGESSPSSAVSGMFSAEILAAVRVSEDSNNGVRSTDSEEPISHQMSNFHISARDVADLDEEGWSQVAKLGDIVELGRLGEGAGGSVTRCRLRYGKTVFALKEITTNPNPELQKQILRELQFNRSCNSPHIVKYYGTFLSHECASIFIAMEYCGGGSLEAIYKRVKARGGRIGEKVLGKVADGVLSGLSYLHERRIIHRDIKPQNILLDSQGQVKLCDFGVSGEVVNSLATTFTGTSYYMAPERIQGQSYTVTSDVWSLGLTLMEVAQHRFPFLQEGHEPLMPIELLTFIVNMPAPELQDEVGEGIRWSDAFRHFLRCCLEKDPKKRASPRQMLNHPWVVGQRAKVVRMDKFVKECWS
jgi:mitogen-activated protein kinase kinase